MKIIAGLVEAEENLDLYVDEEFIGDDGVAPFTIFNEEIPKDLGNMQVLSIRFNFLNLCTYLLKWHWLV